MKFESTLFSKPEQDYLNYYLNKSEFINSLDLRLALDNYIQDDDYILTYNEDIKTLRYTQN